jgi:hypothetical protein
MGRLKAPERPLEPFPLLFCSCQILAKICTASSDDLMSRNSAKVSIPFYPYLLQSREHLEHAGQDFDTWSGMLLETDQDEPTRAREG